MQVQKIQTHANNGPKRKPKTTRNIGHELYSADIQNQKLHSVSEPPDRTVANAGVSACQLQYYHEFVAC